MKKILLLIVCVAMTCIAESFAQTPTANKTGTKVIVSEIDTIKAKAEKWFKDVYVAQYFKDPYSYRLMGVKASEVSTKEALTKQLATAQRDIDACDLQPQDRTQEKHDFCMVEYEKRLMSAKKEQEYIDKDDNAEYHKKRQDVYKEYGLKYLELAKKIAMYILSENRKTEILTSLSVLTEDQRLTTLYYNVQVDCYQKNALGNEVLGRFVFPFTINGPLGDKNGVDNVINKNE